MVFGKFLNFTPEKLQSCAFGYIIVYLYVKIYKTAYKMYDKDDKSRWRKKKKKTIKKEIGL